MNRIRAFFCRLSLVRRQELAALRQEVAQHRHAAALFHSLHGADLRPGANCDTELHYKFAQLERDYEMLEKETAELRVAAASYRRLALAAWK